ncbi:MAG: hypothetical protein HIU57_04710 [Acidobacteria bacterium]|nr:hypothetical protein [Acidobacteriota bacterium]
MSASSDSAPTQARQVLAATQVVFFVCVAMCVAIAHPRQVESYGISYFGVHAPTLPIISIGYGVASVGLWRSARFLAPLDVAPLFTSGLRVIALALPLLLLTPFNHGAFFNWAHMAVGTVIGVTQMSAATYLFVRQRRTTTTIAFFLQLAGGLVAAASLPDWGFNHMLEGELVFEVAFAWCLVLWTYVVPARPLAGGTPRPTDRTRRVRHRRLNDDVVNEG